MLQKHDGVENIMVYFVDELASKLIMNTEIVLL